MRRKHTLIALATVLAFSAGLPALGSILPIYHVDWNVQAEAYAIAEGACGYVDPPMPDGQRRHLTFCFGTRVESTNTNGSVGESVVVQDLHCYTDEEFRENCWTESVSWSPGETKTVTIDPLLESATVAAPGKFDCESGVALTLAATGEPGLSTQSGGSNTHGDLAVEGGSEEIHIGTASGSVGRPASIAGTICGLTVGADGHGGRIMRGLGTTGAMVGVDYS